ncbi:alpha-L-fucosidase [Enterobacter hormaechei]|nr:alpha-L-fucosidase [Enterobacter hormaechei]MZY79164.1 alpha-L-fucosidase [Enterobacter hormaechei]MZY95988.1 alpha-L-fucosidase [Enterobacter hormaechei]MZZ21580.1 alpha-L-fucosidase [Enterobacter hormaechei]QOX73125.1 alpha-L-fucosidase [Enterobacter hormaechei]
MFCFIMVKKHSVLFMNNAIFTSAFNGLAQFFVKNQTKTSIFQAIKQR